MLEYNRNSVYIPSFGKKGFNKLYVKGHVLEAKMIIPVLREKVLADCIRNPKRFLR